MAPRELEQRRARTEAAVGRGGVRRDAAEARRARVAKSRAARAERDADHDHDHDHEGPHTHDEDGNAVPIEDVEVPEAAADEIPGEPTEDTIEIAEEAQAEDAEATEPKASDDADEEKS
jgi:hypothetical protein